MSQTLPPHVQANANRPGYLSHESLTVGWQYLADVPLRLASCSSLLFSPLKAYEAIRTSVTRRREWPKPLSRCQRSCSIATATNHEHVINAGLLAQLPSEVRLQIYEYVLGGRRINILHCPRERRLEHRCQHCSRVSQVDYLLSGEPQRIGGYWAGPPCQLGALLRTCRLVYTEAVEVLYTRNSFGVDGFENLATFVCFSQTIRPERLVSISTLTVSIQYWWRIFTQGRWIEQGRESNSFATGNHLTEFTYPHSEYRDPDREFPWRQLWQIVASEMTGLRKLNLRLTDFRHAFPRELLILDLEAPWLLPILEVPELEQFTLEMLPPVSLDEGLNLCDEDVANFEVRVQEILHMKPRLAHGEVGGSISTGRRR